MSKDTEGTEEFSHNSSSVFAHNAAPLTRTCSQITLSAPRRHVDLNVGWMLSEHYVFPILPPPSCLSWLIKRVIEGDCDWVEGVKSEAREITSIMGKGLFFSNCSGKWGWDEGKVHESAQEGRRKKGRGCVQAGGWQQRREKKGKREGEDTSAAAWFTECTVTMETFVSPLSSIQSGSPTSDVWGGGGAWPGGGRRGKKVDRGCWQKEFHPLECLSYLLLREGCIWCNCISNVNKMLLLMGLLVASLPPLASIRTIGKYLQQRHCAELDCAELDPNQC